MEPPVKIPEEIAHIFGTKEGDTRLYRRDGGTEEENAVWFDAVCEVAGPCVSPGGACMYAPVSRGAVHQRIKDGKLTAFLFHVKRKRKNWLGRPRETRSSPFIYIPVCELKTWAEEIKDRAVKQGTVTREQLEDAAPDWKGEFLEWKNKSEREHLFDFLDDNNMSVLDLIKLLITGSQTNPAYKEYLKYVEKTQDADVLKFGEWVEKFKGGKMDKKWRLK